MPDMMKWWERPAKRRNDPAGRERCGRRSGGRARPVQGGLSHADHLVDRRCGADHRAIAAAVPANRRTAARRHLLCHAEPAGGGAAAGRRVRRGLGRRQPEQLQQPAAGRTGPLVRRQGPSDRRAGRHRSGMVLRRRNGDDHRRRQCAGDARRRSAPTGFGSGSPRRSRRVRSAGNNCVLPCPNRCGSNHEDQRSGAVSGGHRSARHGRSDAFACWCGSPRRRAWKAGGKRGSIGGWTSLPPGARPCWRCWPAGASTTSKSCTSSRPWRRRPCGRRWKWPCGTCSAGVLRQPLCNLLGGYYRRRVPVSIRLSGHKAGRTAQIARELADQGFHTQTIAASGRPEEDLRTLASCPPEVTLITLRSGVHLTLRRAGRDWRAALRCPKHKALPWRGSTKREIQAFGGKSRGRIKEFLGGSIWWRSRQSPI